MINAGYNPDPNWVTRDEDDIEEKKKLVCLHSENF
jgi:hypothetical protein